MSTFSQIVDELVTEHIRPDLLVTITSFVNLVIREVHSEPKTSMPVLFDSNRKEAEGLVTVVPALWEIPSVPKFQRLETVYYNEYQAYAKQRHPSRAYSDATNLSPFFWYRSGPFISLSGIELGHTYKMTYFEFPRTLPYYIEGERPAVWNEETQSFSYLAAYNTDDETREAARELTSNWLLARWKETIKQGVRAKVFVRLGERDRATLNYSLFEQMRGALAASESLEQNPDGA